MEEESSKLLSLILTVKSDPTLAMIVKSSGLKQLLKEAE